MSKNALPIPLDRWIVTWLAHQRALGRGYDNEEWILGHLRCFIVSTGAGDLDHTTFDRWCDSFRCLSATTRRGRQLVVHKLCLVNGGRDPRLFGGERVSA